MITPIETVYQNFRFRSRLEARWAVFFDALGLQYQYEPQGYVVNGVAYLPDFWLPELGYWIEIKPTEEYIYSPEDEDGLEIVGHEVYGCRRSDAESAYVLVGSPGFTPDARYINDFHYEGFPHWGDNGYLWCECPNCGSLGLQYGGRSNRLDCKKRGCPEHGKHGDREDSPDSPRILAALTAAQQARFEHGEKPNPWRR